MNTLPIADFGRQLILTQDLDPVYVALTRVQWGDSGQRLRWLLSYWLLYHCGVASYLSQYKGRQYWDTLMDVALNMDPAPVGGRWPRGRERRHFRGALATSSVLGLVRRYSTPEEAVEYMVGAYSLAGVSDRVEAHRGFGPWISFKVADMAERVLGREVSFTEGEVMMFKDPRQGALMAFDTLPLSEATRNGADDQLRIHTVVRYLLDSLSDLKAPPSGDRPLNIQEVETILCKWKSHTRGHYPVGMDTHEIREGLVPWSAVCGVAGRVLAGLPSGR